MLVVYTLYHWTTQFVVHRRKQKHAFYNEKNKSFKVHQMKKLNAGIYNQKTEYMQFDEKQIMKFEKE